MNFRIIGTLMLALFVVAAPTFAREHGNRLERMAKFLELTEEQKSQIQPMMEQMKQKVQAEREAFRNHLNPDQLAKIEEMKAKRKEAHKSGEGKKMRGKRGEHGQRFIEELNLDQSQQAAFKQMHENIKAERQRFKQNLQALLTPEQQQKLSERKGKHHRRNKQEQPE